MTVTADARPTGSGPAKPGSKPLLIDRRPSWQQVTVYVFVVLPFLADRKSVV